MPSSQRPSCRVLGRQVEEATLRLVAAAAKKLGAKSLIGEYVPTVKNGTVREHYGKLGFTLLDTSPDGSAKWRLALAEFKPAELFMIVKQG
jgi:predicted enzyme involved in methoxymalonyl-ACP biosynthesis